jgi:purine-binding chemotaxis protein CheW
MNTAVSALAEELLAVTFRMGDAVFGLDAVAVEEVVRPGEITPLHHAPPDVVGIRNLRGRIVTILDCGSRLGLGPVRPGPENRILIAEARGEPVGLLVECVLDSISVSTGALTQPPANLHLARSATVRGLCRHEGRLIALIDLEALLADEGGTTSDTRLA